MGQYAVLDVETTGLFPEKYDRVIEVAIITLDDHGKIINEFETLINPDRDLGPTHVHKISAKMILEAPQFKQIAGDIIEHIAGKHIVGHNVNFDYRFIKHEFARLGVEVPDPEMICTLSLSKVLEPDIPCRSLSAICSYFNISIENAHSAYSDCCSTAKLFQTFLKEYGAQLSHTNPTTRGLRWPSIPQSNIQYKRKEVQLRNEETYIEKLIERLPNNIGCSDKALEYLYILDQVLADRKVTLEEAEDLYKLAREYNLSKTMAIQVHEDYLRNLIRIALLDGKITAVEMNDIEQCAKLLNIPLESLERIIHHESFNLNNQMEDKNNSEKDYAGKSVCFTGTLNTVICGQPMTREEAHKIALENGLIVKNSVTKDLDFLVTADPDSMSGKAKKARQYGTKVLAEQFFWNMLKINLG
ncbi:MAG: exonuclease domain-containing protein [Desulfitobacterium sp.]